MNCKGISKNKIKNFEGNCLDLALEGERLCRIGEYELGVQYFEKAVSVGNTEPKNLYAIYSQLGNAYFILQNYSKSLEYHNLHLNLARSMGDRIEEAKASGDIGNTLKSFGKYEEASLCCQRHLDISKELNDKASEAKALYNLGNIFHTKCKQIAQNSIPGSFPQECKDFLELSMSYYEASLSIARELDDKASIGRTCGNLGNSHYLFGNFKKSIIYHQERLSLAESFEDLSAQRRAHTNLGNAYMFMGEFRKASQHYNKALEAALKMKDLTLEAQACYNLGNTYRLIKDFPNSIKYLTRHLEIAQQLKDLVGESKACRALSQVYTTVQDAPQAMDYANKHLMLCKDVGDHKGYEIAQVVLNELKTLAKTWEDESGFKRANSCREKAEVDDRTSLGSRHRSMENLTPPYKSSSKFLFKAPDITLWKRQVKGNKSESSSKKCKGVKKQSSVDSDEGTFFDLLSKYQSRRLDDQRCSSNVFSKNSCSSDEDKENQGARNGAVGNELEEDFLDMLVGIQGSRMDDQRSQLPLLLSGRNQSHDAASIASAATISSTDEQFFEMIMRCQSARLDSQRSALPSTSPPLQAPTVPNDDIMNLMQHFPTSPNRLSSPDILNH